MIVPSEIVKAYANGFQTRRELCEKLQVDEASLSKYLSEERDCSPHFIEAIIRETGFDFEKAFILKNDEPLKRRKEDR